MHPFALSLGLLVCNANLLCVQWPLWTPLCVWSRRTWAKVHALSLVVKNKFWRWTLSPFKVLSCTASHHYAFIRVIFPNWIFLHTSSSGPSKSPSGMTSSLESFITHPLSPLEKKQSHFTLCHLLIYTYLPPMPDLKAKALPQKNTLFKVGSCILSDSI